MKKNRSCPILLKFIPHGLNNNFFYPINGLDPKFEEFQQFKNQLFSNKEYKFTALFNSRNIRRKQVTDAILAWRLFCDKIGEEKAKECCLVLHTQALDEHGTDLPAVIDLLCPDYCNVIISNNKLDVNQMNYLYNSVDAGILLSSNEGWGLMLTECLLTGTPFIANTTGGMQDQMRFEDENGNWIDFNKDFPSNHRGTYKKHGEWAFPVYPKVRTLVGSIPTPYIYDDICDAEDATERLLEMYNLGVEDLKTRGLKGLEWALSEEAGFTMTKQAERVIESLDTLFETWKPREKYSLSEDTDFEVRKLKHKILY